LPKSSAQANTSELKRVRLDKWLWAARFYKTRAIAKQAIDGGKVQLEGGRTKPSKEIEVGMQITLRQGHDEKTIIVSALSEQRRGASQAQLLYQETAESLSKRQQITEQRRAQPSHWQTAGKPNKKDRRLIHKFKQIE
jgi:ribosome-associated heat shock protein Hsp15